jgi:predicted aspartyl protease
MLGRSFLHSCVSCCLLFLWEPVRAQEMISATTPLEREISFRSAHGYLIVVQGQIGNLDKLSFILDTGTTRSMISRKLADNLGLERHPFQLLNFGKSVSVECAIVPIVRIGPIRKTNVQLVVLDLAHYSRFADNVDGIIGMDLLDRNNFTVNFAARKVLFNTVSPDATMRPAQSQRNCVTVTIEIQGQPVTLVLDTGVQGILLFERRLYSRIPALRTSGPPAEANIGGLVRAKQVTLPDVHLGSRILRPDVLLIDAPPDGVLPGIDGFLGTGPLMARRINFDFVTGTLRWD